MVELKSCGILGEGVAEAEDMVDNNGYADYYDDSPATHKISDYG